MPLDIQVRTPAAGTVTQALDSVLRHHQNWDGRSCILELQRADYQWRQMEWIGWYFEWKARSILTGSLGGSEGPRIGNMSFDYGVGNEVWDFKSHPHNQSATWAYMNDVEAIDDCIRTRGHVGWVIANGEAIYETDGRFKGWHDELKGKPSDYELDRIARGAKPRKRKTAFVLEQLVVIELRSQADIQRGLRDGWLRRDMQLGQRQSDGSSRRAKYGVHIGKWLETT